MHLWPGDWQAQLKYMNCRIRVSNKEKKNVSPWASSARVRCIKEVLEQEFWVFWGLIIVAQIMGRKEDLWDKIKPEGKEPRIDYLKHKSEMYHRDIRSFIPHHFADPTKKHAAPWWQITKLMNRYNANQKQTLCVLWISMSLMSPCLRSVLKQEPRGTCLIYPIFFVNQNHLALSSKC